MMTSLAQAVLLLTLHLPKSSSGDAKPLTPVEWGRFALWLKAKGLTPDFLLTGEPRILLKEWRDKRVTVERICALLSRSPALALSLEKWQRAGLWVVTRQDPDYPSRLKHLLQAGSPPFFFGCGDRQSMNRGGLAVVGSRNAVQDDLVFAHDIGAKAAEEGCALISGGARGIDTSAMTGALENEGTVVGVMADHLLKAATSARHRDAVMAGNLVLISPVNPEAAFDVGNAMARNKYIYCLADAALVVHSGPKGGTWSGALENLKHGWVPLWVKRSSEKDSGNALIVQQGARWLAGNPGETSIRGLFKERDVDGTPRACGLQRPPVTPQNAVGEGREVYGSDAADALETAGRTERPGRVDGTDLQPDSPAETESMSFYELFLRRVQALTEKESKTTDQLAEELELCKAQLNVWIKRAVTDNHLRKLSKPVRYAWQSSVQRPKQATIF